MLSMALMQHACSAHQDTSRSRGHAFLNKSLKAAPPFASTWAADSPQGVSFTLCGEDLAAACADMNLHARLLAQRKTVLP